MAKIASWLVQDGPMTAGIGADGKPCAVVTFRVRRWHPGFWLFALKAVWRAVR